MSISIPVPPPPPPLALVTPWYPPPPAAAAPWYCGGGGIELCAVCMLSISLWMTNRCGWFFGNGHVPLRPQPGNQA